MFKYLFCFCLLFSSLSGCSFNLTESVTVLESDVYEVCNIYYVGSYVYVTIYDRWETKHSVYQCKLSDAFIFPELYPTIVTRYGKPTGL